jgi:hypothetical protein
MPRTTDCHDHVATPSLPHPDGLFEPAAARDTAVDVVDPHAPPSQRPIPLVLGPRPLAPAGLLRGWEDVHTGQCTGLKAQIVQQLTARRQRRGRGLGEALVMDTAWRRLTQEEKAHGPIDPSQVFQRVPLFLAALTRFLCSRIVGARDGSRGAIMTQRGAAGGEAACPASWAGVFRGGAGTSPPRRACKAATWRKGASPTLRKVVRNTGSRT